MISLEEYSKLALSTAIYPGKGTDQGLNYTLVGLGGEAGEVLNKWKKNLRGDATAPTKGQLLKELGGVLWYLNAASKELGSSLQEVGQMNIDELLSRKERGTLQGNGDDR